TEYALQNPKSLKSVTLASPLLSSKIWVEDAKQLLSQLPMEVQRTIWIHEHQGTTDSPEYLNAVDIYYHRFVCRMKKWPEELKYSVEHLNMNVYNTMWGVSEFSMTGNLKYFDRMADLKYLNMPVLITGGKYDEARPNTLAFAAEKIPHGQFILYKHSSHMAMVEEEEKYLKNLHAFLKAADKS
ncbi:MAG: alpha/beta fold hydrolase, partial [Legionellaceae bacterium]|nr:alpha/beta fold hydrolase [Legionellaceae bacterium]